MEESGRSMARRAVAEAISARCPGRLTSSEDPGRDYIKVGVNKYTEGVEDQRMWSSTPTTNPGRKADAGLRSCAERGTTVR
jgi:hypothetical protein